MVDKSVDPRKFTKEVRDRIVLAVSGAFALIIGLAWMNFINALITDINKYIGLAGAGVVLEFASAVMTTIICVAGILYLSRWSEKKT